MAGWPPRRPRFGFLQRYCWEAWHYGYERPPPPCSEAGNAVGAGGGQGGDGALAGAALPSFVPARFRAPLLARRGPLERLRSAARRPADGRVNFNPFAVSPAGAQGIAQFIPSTAASYGLADPFDPVEAIDAQAHLMSDLIRSSAPPSSPSPPTTPAPPRSSLPLRPRLPETQAYVSRILALLGGAGALAAPSFEVRLVA